MNVGFRASRISTIFGLALLALPLLALPLVSVAQPAIEWQRCFGANSDDYFFSIIQTRDGGYAACGYSLSDTLPRHHPGKNEDAYVVKMDAAGNLEWQKCYGGSANEEAYQIIQTLDGGFAVAIRSESSDGDVHFNNGCGDAWIVKLSDTGAIEWSQVFGGPDEEVPEGIVEEPDQSLVFAGANRSVTPETGLHHGGSVENDDGWVIRLNAPHGSSNWERYLGGSMRENFQSITKTRDGGFAVVGWTNSSDFDVTGYRGKDTFCNVWICKLDAGGNIEPNGQYGWQKQFGGSSAQSFGNCVIQTSDGGYAIAAATEANDGDVTGNHGGRDGWIVKIDSVGVLQWERCVGGSLTDGMRCVVQDPDGGFTAVGTALSTDEDVIGNHGNYDGWMVKLDANGKLLWQKCLGGSSIEILYSVVHTNDGGLIAAGEALSNDGDVIGSHGGYEGWVVKFGPQLDVTSVETQAGKDLALTATLDPIGNSAKIGYRTRCEHSDLEIEIANVLGTPVVHAHATEDASGDHSRSLDVSHLANGMYFVTARACGLVQTRPILIVR